MSWTVGNPKRVRFENSQAKKSLAAGLKRPIKDDEIVVTSAFIGTFDNYVDSIWNEMSYGDCLHNTTKTLAEARKTAIESILTGLAKLASGEEIRNYVPKDFK